MTDREAAHYRDAFAAFPFPEFLCQCGCGKLELDVRLVEGYFEFYLGLPHGASTYCSSGYRCPAHGLALTKTNPWASKRSKHMRGKALDLHPRGFDPSGRPCTPVTLLQVAVTVPVFASGGIGVYDWGIHVDCGWGPRRWAILLDEDGKRRRDVTFEDVLAGRVSGGWAT